eukprot:scaffold884_cov398-Prasinococcus_capsulatus_cf.AAC.7
MATNAGSAGKVEEVHMRVLDVSVDHCGTVAQLGITDGRIGSFGRRLTKSKAKQGSIERQGIGCPHRVVDQQALREQI